MRSIVGVTLLLSACGTATLNPPPKVAAVAPLPVTRMPQPRELFEDALAAFVAHDAQGDWTEAICREVAERFEEAGKGHLPEATFDAGLAYARCSDDVNAEPLFRKAVAEDPSLESARARFVLYRHNTGASLDEAIAALQRAVIGAQFRDLPSLVNLAALQMRRDASQGGDGCVDDLECAKNNLQRALAIDEGYMPALNQLALYYLQRAQKRAAGRPIDTQQLETAALVASQAMRRDASYAPIRNTAGLIQQQLGKPNLAVQFFAEAAHLDPTLFEAHANLGQANLSFHGFASAESAFRRALALRPRDYDTHLGLAVALRGQIDPNNSDAQIAAVQAELDLCKQLDPARPDVLFNEAVLTQEYKTRAPDIQTTLAELGTAKRLFEEFLAAAGVSPRYANAAIKAKLHIQDVQDIINFLSGAPANLQPPPAPPPPPKQPRGRLHTP